MRAASTSVRTTLLPVLALAAALALAGCVDAPPQVGPTEGAATPLPTAPSVLPTDTATQGQGDLDISCADLVDPDAVYAFDPNFGLVGTFTPAAGSAGARATEWNGVLCRWVRESGGITIDLAVAQPGDAALAELKREAFATSTQVPTYGEDAYFDAATGTAIVFEGPFWLVITSPAFAEPGEPAEMIRSALATLAAR